MAVLSADDVGAELWLLSSFFPSFLLFSYDCQGVGIAGWFGRAPSSPLGNRSVAPDPTCCGSCFFEEFDRGPYFTLF